MSDKAEEIVEFVKIHGMDLTEAQVDALLRHAVRRLREVLTERRCDHLVPVTRLDGSTLVTECYECGKRLGGHGE